MEIERNRYLERLISRMNNGMIKVITGIRRCGKASLVKISDSFKKIIVVNSNTPVWRNDQGILVMNLYDFLLNENSLDM